VFGVVFGVTALIDHPSGVQVYLLYLMTGILPWGFFSLITNLGMGSLLGNSAHYLMEHNTLSPTIMMFQDIVDSVNR
jgi:ABC-type polysaccharide/polyol phosphate export permease